MLTDQIETVLISTKLTPTDHERIVVAFRDGNDIFIPLDKGRAVNEELLACDQLYVRESDAHDEYSIYQIEGHRVISTLDRQRLEAFVRRPFSVTTEMLHLSGTHVAAGRLHHEPAGFVAVVDGSERASRALGPAQAIAEWYGRPLKVCVVTAGQDDVDTRRGVRLQLEGPGIGSDEVLHVDKPGLEGQLFELMRQGHILVASAFGVWEANGRLHGMIHGLVRHNAPAIIGIGPNVPLDWKPAIDHPLVVFVDASEHAHDVVDRIDTFLTPPRDPLMVVHVTTEEPPNTDIAAKVATEMTKRFGIPVEARNVAGSSPAEAIAEISSTVDAQMAVLTSWHRPRVGEPKVASASVTSVAHAPCPVVILSSQ